MNILFDYQIFTLQTHGGISRYHYELLKHLRLEDVTCDVGLLLSNNYYIRKGDVNITKHISFFPSFNLKIKNNLIHRVNQCYLLHVMKNKHIDIFHPTYYDDYFLKECTIRKIPFVLTVHDMTAEKYIPNDTTIQQKHRLIKRADKIIAISHNTKNDILYYLDDIDPSKIDVVYHGINTGKIEHLERVFSRPYILYVGARYSYKNFRLLVDAFSKIASKYDDLMLVCTGLPFSLEEITYLKSLNIADRVVSRFVSDEELCSLYKFAIFFVFPSLYEGFGLPILEAFKYNCPVIASNASCFSEIGGDAISYFDPLDKDSLVNAMSSLLEKSEFRKSLIQKGRIRMKMFSWEHTAKETMRVYKSIL